jgi:hypothetical protein
VKIKQGRRNKRKKQQGREIVTERACGEKEMTGRLEEKGEKAERKP